VSYLSPSELATRREAARRRGVRRRLAAAGTAAALIAVTVAAIAINGSSASSTPAPAPITSVAHGSAAHTSTGHGSVHHAHGAAPVLPPIQPARPGVATVYQQGPPRPEVALTIDDGFCATCVARLVRALERTHAHATIFPNGRYSASWDPVAPAIRRLIAAGQLTIGNHTFLHMSALEESSSSLETDLTRNEDWIEHTFGVSSRPFFRPPYGAYNSSALAVAGQLGYTKVIMWSGTVADSNVRTVGYILGAIRHWAKPGAIILMHGNYPATSFALPQIVQILHQRGLRPVTLAELLG
jgi:peptidoglycan/xylan/chitin deacetylase (PgdA/CDA1 family)